MIRDFLAFYSSLITATNIWIFDTDTQNCFQASLCYIPVFLCNTCTLTPATSIIISFRIFINEISLSSFFKWGLNLEHLWRLVTELPAGCVMGEDVRCFTCMSDLRCRCIEYFCTSLFLPFSASLTWILMAYCLPWVTLCVKQDENQWAYTWTLVSIVNMKHFYKQNFSFDASRSPLYITIFLSISWWRLHWYLAPPVDTMHNRPTVVYFWGLRSEVMSPLEMFTILCLHK